MNYDENTAKASAFLLDGYSWKKYIGYKASCLFVYVIVFMLITFTSPQESMLDIKYSMVSWGGRIGNLF